MANKSILFSVIMPAYNAGAFIADSIRSVLNQTYKDFELIIIDDGSTDNTFNIINEFNDERIIVVRQQNMGLGIARNVGIENSTNDYIAFLDSDDIWSENKLMNVVVNMDTKVGLYYSNVMEFKTSIEESIPHKYREPINKININDLILVYDYIVVSSVVVPSVIIKELGGFTTDLYGTEDWDLWIKIAQKYTFKKIDNYDCFYRMNANGLSKKRREFLKKEFEVINRHLIYGNLGSPKIRKLALWVWYKKNFYYHLNTLHILSAFKFFFKMIIINPRHPANFDFIKRFYKKVLSRISKLINTVFVL